MGKKRVVRSPDSVTSPTIHRVMQRLQRPTPSPPTIQLPPPLPTQSPVRHSHAKRGRTFAYASTKSIPTSEDLWSNSFDDHTYPVRLSDTDSDSDGGDDSEGCCRRKSWYGWEEFMKKGHGSSSDPFSN
ncbi:hypothetical protein CJ030_MR4G010911 [Morella rubra]|uniref:Uncharacterized protein n=1 Tax=Morella rubra TaxID=262757 RepID=A0A6A1VW76_9ROSI|nr:hypothetical protein CJ030_MR4G010911 [Morella rubra]